MALKFKTVKNMKITDKVVKATRKAKEGGASFNNLTEPGEYTMVLVSKETKKPVKSDKNWHGFMFTFEEVESKKTHRVWVPAPVGGTIWAKTKAGEPSLWAYDQFARMAVALGWKISDCVLGEGQTTEEMQAAFDESINTIITELFATEQGGLGSKVTMKLVHEGNYYKMENGKAVLYLEEDKGVPLKASMRANLNNRQDVIDFMKSKNYGLVEGEPRLGGLAVEKIVPFVAEKEEADPLQESEDIEEPEDFDSFASGDSEDEEPSEFGYNVTE